MTQTVLITGTSSGLGRATAQLFADRGWNVVATMRTPAPLFDAPNVLVTRLDVQDAGSITTAVEAGLARFGRIDALINNAGYGAYGPLESTPWDTVERQFGVNVLGPLATIQAVLPHFRERGSGVIVNISSIGGRLAFPLGTLYHGTKFAVEGFSESLHYELGELGIRVKLVEPGGIRTDFGGRSLAFHNEPAIPDYQPLVRNVLGELGPLVANGSEPAAIAEVVYGAVTDGSDQLRYAAGPDAEQILAARQSTGDAGFLPTVKAQFGLA
ncbi:SDR family oxidoreductase [Actinoplanes sp. RD1]|uniref:SDR family oxidoreductase n=1 Tax=Actinoplanes sp. RD1 TaxID=3064538 RepID=UPI00274037F0|nr:SDR family oxidoreductase [Actinoplanes sp. RD1]